MAIAIGDDLIRAALAAEQAQRDELERDLVHEIHVLTLEHDRTYAAMRDEMFQRTGNLTDGKFAQFTFTVKDSIRMEELISESAVALLETATALGPAIQARARVIALAMDGSLLPPHLRVLEISGAEADEFVRPLFEAGGIADRYIGDREIMQNMRATARVEEEVGPNV